MEQNDEQKIEIKSDIIEPSREVKVQEKENTKRRSISLRATIIICFICIFLSSLLTASGLSLAYLIGKKNNNASSIDSSRKTVVKEGEVIADVAQKVGPSVVSVITKQNSTVQSDFFGTQTRTQQAAGTGLIIDSSGYILTNKHVVPSGTTNLGIISSDGTEYKDVEIIGRDPMNDLAIIKVKNPKNFAPANLGDSDSVRVGQKVIAIGNALGQFQNTVTSGIVSGIGRPIEASDGSGSTTEQLTNLFQTDAAINSGNSGGPLLNYNGEVVGINTAVAADAQNIGFSIPINEAKGIIASVKETGKLSKPFLGVKFLTLSPTTASQVGVSVTSGAFVDTEAGSVVAGSPADKAGLKPGDIITHINDIELNERTQLTSAIARFKVGDTITLKIIRDGKKIQAKVVLAEAPNT